MVRRRKDLLLAMLEAAGDGRGSPWHASLLESVEDLDVDQARWSPAPGRPSAWAVVRHVVHWKRGVMEALDRDGLDAEVWAAADWSDLPLDDAAWHADRDELARVTRLLAQRLAAADEGLLDNAVHGFDASIAETAFHVATHDAYHAGQIRLLLRLRDALASAADRGADRGAG